MLQQRLTQELRDDYHVVVVETQGHEKIDFAVLSDQNMRIMGMSDREKKYIFEQLKIEINAPGKELEPEATTDNTE